MRRRVVALTLIALAVPFPALALTGSLDNSPSASATLSVSASLDQCGLAENQIICKIDAGWNSIPGAEDYSITATSADGSVIDMGRTSAQASSVWIPYAGPGTYSVQVTAWGTPPGEENDGKPEVIARSSSLSNGAAGASGPGVTSAGGSAANDDLATTDPVVGGSESPPDPVDEAPSCTPEPPAEEPPTTPAPPSETSGDGSAPDAPVIDDPQDDAGTIPVDDDCNG